MILTLSEQLPAWQPPAQLLARVVELLERRGFARVDLAEEGRPEDPAATTVDVLLQRGSLWGNLFSSRMERLRQTLLVQLAEEPGTGSVQLRLCYTVSTFAQYVTETNRRFFAEEAAALVEELTDRPGAAARLKAHRWRSSMEWWLGLLLAALLGLLLGRVIAVLFW